MLLINTVASVQAFPSFGTVSPMCNAVKIDDVFSNGVDQEP